MQRRVVSQGDDHFVEISSFNILRSYPTDLTHGGSMVEEPFERAGVVYQSKLVFARASKFEQRILMMMQDSHFDISLCRFADIIINCFVCIGFESDPQEP